MAKGCGFFRIEKILGRGDAAPRPAPRGPDDHAAAVAEAPQVPVLEHAVVLAHTERPPALLLDGRISVQDADDLDATPAKRARGNGNDRVGSGCRAAREHQAHAFQRR